MNEYRFFIDEKVTMWQRHKYSILADTYEEAEEIMIKKFEDEDFYGYTSEGDYDSNYEETEELFETVEKIRVEDNNGSPTLELFYQDRNSPTWEENQIKTNLNQ